jgi:glycine dehydrogenase
MDGTPRAAARSLAELEYPEQFIAHHIGPSEADVASMLASLGQPNLAALVDAIVPDSIRLKAPLALGEPVDEAQALARLGELASRIRVARSYIGMGYQAARLPPVIARNVLQNPAWYTAYTPYQAEIAQGRLEGMLNFQTMVCDLTGLQVANASLLDEATAAAEAMLMSRRSSGNPSSSFFVSINCHPQTIAVLETRAQAVGIELRVGQDADARDIDAFGYLFQYPASNGELPWSHTAELAQLVEAAHARDALVTVAADPLALVLLVPPGEWGADLVIGSAQRFGLPLGFGGPHAAFMSCRDALKRSLPGRVVGVSVDAQGGPALRLALQTREQHIRRERATSNICTAQALNALAGVVYLSWLGRQGIVELGELLAARTHYARGALAALEGVELAHEQPVIREFALRLDADVVAVKRRCAAEGINPGVDVQALSGRPEDRGLLLVAITERRTREQIDRLTSVLGAAVAAEREAVGV